MFRKKQFTVMAALLAVTLTACGGNMEDTASRQVAESASASELSSGDEESKAEEQTMLSDLEYVVKNDLEIDGVPVSIPCSKDELLDALGEKYSFDEVDRLLYNGN